MNITATQTKLKNKSLSYFRFRLAEMKVLIVINFIITISGFPVAAAILARYTRTEFETIGVAETGVFGLGMLITIIPLAAVGMMLISYACAINAFGHLHNKNICDMHLSLPLTHRQRFWTNFTVGLSVTVIPYAISAFVGMFIFRVFSVRSELTEMLEAIGMRGIEGYVSEYMLPVAITGLVALVMTYSLTVFCNTLCGNGFTAAFVPLLLSGVIPLLTLTMSILSMSNAHGINTIGSFPYIISTPVGFVLGNVGLIRTHGIFAVNMPIIIVPVMLIIVGLVVGGFYLSKGIKAENIGRDFLYKSIYNVQQCLVCLCVVSLFGIFFVNNYYGLIIFWAILISLIAFTIGHIAHHKGLRKIKSGVIKYAAVFTSSVLICAVFVVGKGFGAESYVPSADSIKGVKITAWSDGGSVSLDSDIFPGDYSWDWRLASIVNYERADQKEIAAEARRIHKLLVDTPNTERVDGRYNTSVMIVYELRNGLVIQRNYYYSEEDIDMLIDRGILSR
ncbi:MAG: hypothetical protein FWH07_08265 [Oscillospiraceae bacterium]|nr:hypothetical protein [Oscillospiraceae bacterium]